MSGETRQRHSAEYFYPGSFFPEETYRSLTEPTLAAALKAEPDDKDGYFRKGGWYAVVIRTSTEKRFEAADGSVEWVRQGRSREVARIIVGEKVHGDALPDDDEHRILKANIACNGKSGYGVRTRAGNWQIADDWGQVISPAEATS